MNDDWLKVFPEATTWFQTAVFFFDHASATVHLVQGGGLRRARFRYSNMWALAPQFSEVVARGWRLHTYGDPMHQVMFRLKRLRTPLVALGKSQFPDILKQLDAARSALIKAQEELERDKWNAGLISAGKWLVINTNSYPPLHIPIWSKSRKPPGCIWVMTTPGIFTV